MEMPDEINLTPEQLVARWGGAVCKGTLANWRSKKIGPKFIKPGKRVRYPLSAVRAYEEEKSITPVESKCRTS